MHDEIAQQEPTELTAGMSWRWDRHLPDHAAADGWSLTYAVRGADDLDITTVPDGDTYQVRVTPADTALPAGTYMLTGYVERGAPDITDREIVYRGMLEVLANPLLAVGRRTHAETTLEVIEAAIEGRVLDGRESFEIDGVQITKIPLDQLVALRGKYATIVSRQRARARTGGKLGAVEVHFVTP